MTGCQPNSEDYEHDSVLHDPPFLQELKLFRPLSFHLSSQHRAFPSLDKCREKSSAQSARSSIHESWNLDGASDMVLQSASSRKEKPAGELCWGLGLGVEENPRRVCRICHKRFSSGRALGGHMRVHGPLFQPAGTKRKLSSVEFQGPRKLHNEDLGLDVSDSKESEISLLSRSKAEKEVLKFEDEDAADEPIVTTDSEAEDSYTNDPHVYSPDGGKDHDAVDEYYSAVGHHSDKHNSIVSNSKDDNRFWAMASSTDAWHPLYELRHKPKKSRRFADQEFAMEQFLYSKGSAFSSLERGRVCSECGKSFGSWKALFGHMRCHPERAWRGVLPPDDGHLFRFAKKKLFLERRPSDDSDHELGSDVENSKEFGTEAMSYEGEKFDLIVESDEGTDHNTDGSADGETFQDGGVGNGKEDGLKHSWPTGKRSRRKSVEGKAESGQPLSPHREEPALTSESGSLEEPQEQGYMEETPNFLLMLAEAARKIEQDTKVRKSLVSKPKNKVKQCGEGDEGAKHAGEALYTLSARDSSNALVKYECSTCKKSFNSHQALGGHRASHRKMKGCFARTNAGDDVGFSENHLSQHELWQGHMLAHEKDLLLNVVEEDMKHQQFKGHECSICHRMFATGQALGGHKRCHYNGERVAEAASFTSSNKQFSDEAHSGKLDTEGGSKLDLNMPAPADEDGTEVTNHASTHSRLLNHEFKEKGTEEPSSKELLLASWPRTADLSGEERRSSPWEFESGWAVGPAVAY